MFRCSEIFKIYFAATGFIAMYATLASRNVDLCLIPESPFYLEGEGGLFEYVEKRLKEDGHMVIVIAEGAGQELLSKSFESANEHDVSGNKLLQDVGLWIFQKIKDHFARHKLSITLKYIDPTYMICAIPGTIMKTSTGDRTVQLRNSEQVGKQSRILMVD